VAGTGNPASLGHTDPDELARHMLGAHRPSGNNREGLLQLAEALRKIGE